MHGGMAAWRPQSLRNALSLHFLVNLFANGNIFVADTNNHCVRKIAVK